MIYDEPTEYDGRGVQPNGIYPKGREALTPSDKLRLLSLTGQTEDPNASPDPGYWNGNDYFDPNYVVPPDPQRLEQERRARQIERNRYKQTPRPRQ